MDYALCIYLHTSVDMQYDIVWSYVSNTLCAAFDTRRRFRFLSLKPK